MKGDLSTGIHGGGDLGSPARWTQKNPMWTRPHMISRSRALLLRVNPGEAPPIGPGGERQLFYKRMRALGGRKQKRTLGIGPGGPG